MGAGAEVIVRRGRLLLRPLTPIPALRRGMLLHPADRDDPFAFMVDFSDRGKGAMPVVFSRFDTGAGTPTLLLNGCHFAGGNRCVATSGDESPAGPLIRPAAVTAPDLSRVLQAVSP